MLLQIIAFAFSCSLFATGLFCYYLHFKQQNEVKRRGHVIKISDKHITATSDIVSLHKNQSA